MKRMQTLPFRSFSNWPTKLPNLPIPTLDETCQLYLSSVQPLVSNSDFKRTSSYVKEFLKESGSGHVLQQRLKDHATKEEAKGLSWLRDWWNNDAYMAYRDSVVVNVSYFFTFKDTRLTAPQRATATILSVLKFKDLMESGRLEADKAKTPLCMNQYQCIEFFLII